MLGLVQSTGWAMPQRGVGPTCQNRQQAAHEEHTVTGDTVQDKNIVWWKLFS